MIDGIFINFSLYLSQQNVPINVQIQYIVVFWFMTVYGLVGWYQPTGGVYHLHLGNGSGMFFYVLNTVNQETTVQITFWNASYEQINYTTLIKAT